jgi:hypothetical protein
MGRAEQENTRVDFRKLRYGTVRLGNFLHTHIEASPDDATREGLNAARAALEEGGLVVLDAHLKFGDIIATGIEITKQIDIQSCVAAVSAYDYQHPLFRRRFFSELGLIPGVELFPIYRTDDERYSKRKIMYQRAVAQDSMSEAVLRYYRRTLQAIKTPHEIVLVAAYNGVGRMGNELASGVAKLLERGTPSICSLAKWSWREGKYRVFLSDKILPIRPQMSKDDMQHLMYAQHRLLFARATSHESS